MPRALIHTNQINNTEKKHRKQRSANLKKLLHFRNSNTFFFQIFQEEKKVGAASKNAD